MVTNASFKLKKKNYIYSSKVLIKFHYSALKTVILLLSKFKIHSHSEGSYRNINAFCVQYGLN